MFKIGDRIEKFTVISKPRSGAVGRVYKVKDAKKRIFAAKVLEVSLQPKWMRRFNQEVNALLKCNHPSIVKVYSSGSCHEPGDDLEKPFLIMEYVDGKNLEEFKGSALDWNYEIATRIIRQVARALEYANSMRIVHRDLKPNNIMIRSDGVSIVVVDFGMAKDIAAAGAERSFTAVGARAYRCAHKTDFPHHVTYSDDIWSLGVTFYNLLCGKMPFWCENEPDLEKAIKEGNYPDIREANQEVPEDVARIVRKMLDRGQTADYKNCRYLLRDLDRLSMFRQEVNRVFLSQNLSTERVSTYQQLMTKIYGPMNLQRTASEICLRLTSAMGRASGLLVEWSEKRDPDKRKKAIEHLTRCFVWLCSLALKVGIDLESAVWSKFPLACPYCLERHTGDSKCSKATKRPIDIWRLRDLANERAHSMPRTLRQWERMFAEVYPKSAAEGLTYLSKKLVEELGEVSAELTKPKKRTQLLRQTGVDSFAFEISDLFAWICQASTALREEATAPKKSILGEALGSRLQFEICPFCTSAICVCDPERETEQKKAMAYYLEYDEDTERAIGED